ncbi:MAG: hypothetical protein JWM56_61 [Candidatus Peribacteria bacterium]|nr:hypothetical protein [Candidatus Peribacteria bacterium]
MNKDLDTSGKDFESLHGEVRRAKLRSVAIVYFMDRVNKEINKVFQYKDVDEFENVLEDLVRFCHYENQKEAVPLWEVAADYVALKDFDNDADIQKACVAYEKRRDIDLKLKDEEAHILALYNQNERVQFIKPGVNPLYRGERHAERGFIHTETTRLKNLIDLLNTIAYVESHFLHRVRNLLLMPLRKGQDIDETIKFTRNEFCHILYSSRLTGEVEVSIPLLIGILYNDVLDQADNAIPIEEFIANKQPGRFEVSLNKSDQSLKDAFMGAKFLLYTEDGKDYPVADEEEVIEYG